ncbi:E3 ubiquitin-protein ligase makorin [Amaranthus tricolor]|uniref:E3 ubiquitin-protein ligase makorin n=1 Tax=Amaranthus tricolor TaxID=29722 RepID=UPI0025842CDE|nr:E3 ubiquitin-protein ligase makorin [Amaranthus tricolor]XP_057524035.1 E3 ubiquitin-protein ligase makorin [Amaranthus tricolor]
MVLCKFFKHGACLKGEHCEYAHDWNAPANNICTFYQRGVCAYGSRCRYDHLKISKVQSSSSSSSINFFEAKTPGVTISGMAPVSSVQPELSPVSRECLPSSKAAWNQQPENPGYVEDDFVPHPRSDRLADQIICSFAAAGTCPRGDKCPHIHGDLCPTCGKHCLHPYRLKEREEHSQTCEKMQKHLEALKQSQEIECSVCLERVLTKPVGERKFGLLSECDHPFCISCIRGWRNSSPSSGMDVNSTLRACPICRKLSYFVIPSVIWYFSNEEKEEIVESYKAKLKSIDCKYFEFGNGSCPFGTSCFYKHSYRDGSVEEVVLRHLGAADGETVIAKNIRLADFLRNLHIS